MLAIFGTALIVLVAVDAGWTTLAAAGGGPLTRWVGAGTWRLAVGRLPHPALKLVGTLIPIGTVLGWLLLLWLGWWLIFSAAEGAVVSAQGGQPADGAARLYFAGYTFFTLGVGDYVPEGALWQALTPIATLSGLVLVTLGVTYLIPLTSADNEKRSLAAMVSSLGTRPAQIVTRSWNGRSFQGLETLLAGLAPTIGLHAQRHLAYPVLHYLHSGRRDFAAAPALARLDEALTILVYGVEPEHQPDPAILQASRRAIEDYLDTLQPFLYLSADRPPSAPDLEAVREAGVPVVTADVFERRIGSLAEHREELVRMVASDGWTWADVGGS